MSNPYDPNQPQQPPQNPYGAPQPGQGGYGGGGEQFGSGGGPYGGNEPKRTDAVSITGFVLSLTCCLSVVGLILGFVGLKRTKNGERKGRWAAVAAIPIGILGTLALVGIIVVVVFFANSVISVDDAKEGQCMDTSDSGDNTVTLTKKECSESHDAEIVYVGVKGDIDPTLTPDDINDLSDTGIAAVVCASVLDAADADTIGDAYDYEIVSEDPDDTDPDSKFICYIEDPDGAKLKEKVL